MKKRGILLGVNIDHVATLREARHTRYPDPLEAVFAAENAGADGITVHLREDRRHIQERDVELIQSVVVTRLNLELALTDSMIAIATKIKPAHCCFVPEKREELTTEGGLDVAQQLDKVKKAVSALAKVGIATSLFIDPEEEQIAAAKKSGAQAIEIHTGAYADAKNNDARQQELARIMRAAKIADDAELIVNAGHGLHYHNVKAIAAIPQINELNIGHSIVARAIFSGFYQAVWQMKSIMTEARNFI